MKALALLALVAAAPLTTFVYPVREVTKVVDGDTFDACVDLVPRSHGEVHLTCARMRLIGIDAPEARTPEGPAATQWLRARMQGSERFVVRHHGRDNFGRWLVTVGLPDGGSVQAEMLDAGVAQPWR